MERGIIYLMSTAVPGLVKIGKTGTDQFETRMQYMERNGYSNITGLKREFALEVDEYGNKEKLLQDIFGKSRIGRTELFALDVELVKSLLSSLEGKQIYPKDQSKEEVFKEATEELKHKEDSGFVPDGQYVLNRKTRKSEEIEGHAEVKDGIFTVLKGSRCGNVGKGYIPSARKKAKIKDGVLQEDMICESPTSAGWIVIGKSNNGWKEWKDSEGNPIEKYKGKEEEG